MRGKNKSARWTMGRGRRGREALPPSHRPPRAFYFFFITAIFIGITSGSLASAGNRVSDTAINA